MNLTIAEIAKACQGTLVLKEGIDENKVTAVKVTEDTLVDSVVLDSRQVTEGGVFVATVGERVDGHSFAAQVTEKGAALILCEKTPDRVEKECGIPADSWCSYLVVENTFQALKDLAEYYRSKLTIPIVGITGSVGKTSTKEFIAGVLEEKYNVLKTQGNYNNEVGVPLTLLRIRQEHTAAVVEMGISDFGEMHRLTKMVRPNVCVITNIGQCHLENLKTRDGILQAKTEIFDYMAEDGVAVLNGDDDKLASLDSICRGKCLPSGGKAGVPLFFGVGNREKESVYASDIQSKGLFGSEAVLHFDEEGKEETLCVKVPLPGVHMVKNSAAAACVGKLLGLTTEEIRKGIAGIQPTDGRGKLIATEKFTLIDDCYNANPVSMKAAIDLLNSADTEKVAILGDMFELGTDSDALHGSVGTYGAKSGVDTFIFIGENARHMYEAADVSNAGRKQLYYYESNDAFLKAYKEQQENLLPMGATVLLKASHGMHFTEILDELQKDGNKK